MPAKRKKSWRRVPRNIQAEKQFEAMKKLMTNSSTAPASLKKGYLHDEFGNVKRINPSN
jgi:hypothetical protein